MEFFKIVYDYVFIIQLFAVCAALIITFYPFEKTKKAVLTVALHMVILFCFGTLLNWGLFELAKVFTPLRGTNFPISWLILILGYLFFYKTPFVNRFLMGSTLFVSVISMINLGRQIMMVIPIHFFADGINFVIIIFIVLYSFLLHKLSLKEYTDLPPTSAVMMAIISTVLSVVIIVKEGLNVTDGTFGFDLYYTMILFSSYIISICSYLMLYFYSKARKSIIQLKVENTLLEADKERIESFERIQEDLHLFRHDINNQMNIIEIMLEKKNYDELQSYFASVKKNIINQKYDFIDCGNSIINSVINMEILKAQRSNIELVSNINVPNQLPFESSDLSRILVNLIDNSIEALERLEDNNKRVNCSIMTHGEYLYIGVQNIISSDANPDKVLKMNTEKEDQINHGLGHKIVKKIANKYNGHVNYSIEDGTFFAEVMLDTMCSAKEVK